MRVCLTVPERFAAGKELHALLREPADLTVFPEGFLRSEKDLALALELTAGRPGTVLAGYRDGELEKAVVVEDGRIIDQYTKCILTAAERERKRPGNTIRCLNSSLGKLAVPICYEVHFPEVCRVMALEDPVLMVNIIGTGMYHRLQYEQWRAIARARAIENEVPVAGCCHFCGEIPLAFAFDSGGRELIGAEGRYGAFIVDVDTFSEKPIGYMADRRPELFGPLSAGISLEGTGNGNRDSQEG